MKFIVAIFAIIGTVYAHCGCLKCSKHLSVAGVVPGAPGQAPVKVIYRSDNGYPSDAGLVGRGLIGGYLTAQPTVQIPAPAPVPEVPASDCGREIPVAIHRLYTPINGDYRGGRSYWDGSFFGRGFADGAYPEYEEGVLTNVGEVGILPVKVQIPEPVTALPTPACTPIEGLTTCLDRVIVSRPPFVYEKHGKQVIPTCCGPITCPLHGCGLYPARYLPPAPAAHQSSSCSCSSR